MKPEVTVVDFGVGNLFSVTRALEACDANVTLTGDPSSLAKADRVLLPGVGAFGDVVAELARHGLDQAVIEFAQAGRPFLGICVGMQILFDVGEEFGDHPGLGLLPGRVAAIPKQRTAGARYKIPHIGWAAISPPENQSWDGTILSNVEPYSAVYFLHSFAAQPENPSDRLAEAPYGEISFTAAVSRDNILGCQFHPERSGPVGLSILSQFLKS